MKHFIACLEVENHLLDAKTKEEAIKELETHDIDSDYLIECDDLDAFEAKYGQFTDLTMQNKSIYNEDNMIESETYLQILKGRNIEAKKEADKKYLYDLQEMADNIDILYNTSLNHEELYTHIKNRLKERNTK